MEINKRLAFQILDDWVKSESLRRHCLSVAFCMEAYAEKLSYSEEKEKWFISGLLHDFDYEKFPDLKDHPFRGCEFLSEKGFPEDIIQAILGHGNHTGVKRQSLMARVLFAVDELSGLVMALAHVRPGKFEGMTSKSVKKVLKKRDFAKNISRADIMQGIKELGIDEKEHFETVIGVLKKNSEELGFS